MRNRMVEVLGALAASTVLLAPAGARAADPTTADCMAAAESSIDLRAQHKLRAARAQLLVCAAASCPPDVRVECLRRVDQVNAGIPTIVFEAKDSVGNDLAGVKVSMDGQPLSDRLEGTAISLDPGEHRFVFETPGRTTIEKMIVLHEAEKERHETIVFGAASAPLAPATVAEPDAAALSSSAAVSTDSPKRDSRRTLGMVVAGAGIAGLAVGSVFGVMANSSWSSSKSECASPANCPNHGQAVSDHDAASTDATISTIALVTGGAALAAGVVLFFSAPARPATGVRWQLVPTLGPGGGGLVLKAGL